MTRSTIIGFVRSASDLQNDAPTWHAMRPSALGRWARSACGMYVAPVGDLVSIEYTTIRHAAEGTGIVGLCGVCRRSRAWARSGLLPPPHQERA